MAACASLAALLALVTPCLQEIEDFFNDVLTRALGRPPPSGGTYVLSVYINHERRFAFVEFGSVELTTACMQLGLYHGFGAAGRSLLLLLGLILRCYVGSTRRRRPDVPWPAAEDPPAERLQRQHGPAVQCQAGCPLCLLPPP